MQADSEPFVITEVLNVNFISLDFFNFKDLGRQLRELLKDGLLKKNTRYNIKIRKV